MKNLKEKRKQKEVKGITLIALVITIIVLLILAAISITTLTGDNGILNKANEAKEKTNIASEKEAIELFILDIINTNLNLGKEISEEKYLGEKLSETSTVTGDWKNVIVGEKVYKEGWYLLEKGKEISEYGKAQSNWLINYDTGELIELEEGKYTVASAKASGAIVDNTLKLNIDPANLQDTTKWGSGVSFQGGNPQNAVTKSELQFDGVDDYLRIKNVNIEKSNGLTFEFYGKFYDSIYNNFIGKNKFNNDEIELKNRSFRVVGSNVCLRLAVGEGDCGSDLSEALLFGNGQNAHWMQFREIKIPQEKDIYISFSIDFENCEIKAYQDGKLKQTTKCSKKYLDGGDIFNNDLDFTIGMIVQGATAEATYSKMKLYSSRLYTRTLLDTEISQNYVATTNYYNELVNQ